MATGTTYTDFNSEKRLLGVSDFGSRFMDHLRGLTQESYEKSFRTGGVYDTALTLAAGGNDKFDIGGTSPATDGEGHTLDIDSFGFGTGVQFENTAAIDYEVALHYTEVPSGVQVNPRKGLPEYIAVEEAIGESADPDLVTDNGTDITFRVDSVAEVGVSHAGRTVRVWKKIPGQDGTTSVVAIEDVVVVWTGSNNEITTSGLLGQGAVSTTPADYTVVMLGPTVRRNSTLLGVDGYAFLGIVTGVGAGSPPAAFDITDQDVFTASLSDLQDITSRNPTTDRLKIDVKSYAGDVNDPQIAVKDPGGSNVFTVDGNGNIVIEGTTTQQDVVIVNSSETITDNLTAGDATSDSHLIKGTWRHTDPGETTNYFYVDGVSGRIGINRTQDATYQLAVNGDVLVQGNHRIESASPAYEWRESDIGLPLGLWRIIASDEDLHIQENTAVAGDFSTLNDWVKFDAGVNREIHYNTLIPAVDNSLDLGISGSEWRNLNIDGIANIDEIVLEEAAGSGVGSNMVPDATNSRQIGSLARRFSETHTRDLLLGTSPGEGVGTHLLPQANLTYNLGSNLRRWDNLFVNNLSFTGDFLPAADAAQDIGSSTFRWAEGHYSDLIHIGDADVASTDRYFNLEFTSTDVASATRNAAVIDATWSTVGATATRRGFLVNVTDVGTPSGVTSGIRSNTTFWGGGGSSIGSVADSIYGFLTITGGTIDVVAPTIIPAGVHGRVASGGTASLTEIAGGLFELDIQAASTVANQYGVVVRIGDSFDATSKSYGFYLPTGGSASGGGSRSAGYRIDNLSGSAITTVGFDMDEISASGRNYGLKIGRVHGGITNNNYAIKTDVGDDEGKIEFGDDPGSRLQSHMTCAKTWAVGETTQSLFGYSFRPTYTDDANRFFVGVEIESVSAQATAAANDMITNTALRVEANEIGGNSTGTLASLVGASISATHNDLGHSVTSVLGLTVNASAPNSANTPSAIYGINVGDVGDDGVQNYSIKSEGKCRIDESTPVDFSLLLGDNGGQDEPLFSGSGLHIKASAPNIFLEDTDVPVGTVGRVFRLWNDGGSFQLRLDRYNEAGGGVLPGDFRVRRILEVNHPYASMTKTATQTFTATWANLTTFSSATSESITTSVANGTYTITVRGTYLISYTLPQGLAGATGGIMQGRVTVNGVPLTNSHSRAYSPGGPPQGSKNGMSTTFIAEAELVNTDVVRIQIQERNDTDGPPVSFSQVVDLATNSVANAQFSITAIKIFA